MSLTPQLLLVLYVGVIALLISGFFFLRRQFRAEEDKGHGRQGAAGAVAGRGGDVAAAAAGRRDQPRARGALERMRRGRQQAAAPAVANEEDGHAGADDEGAAPAVPMDRAARLAAEREASRAAREAVRAQQEAAEQAKRAKEDKYAARAAAREEEREALARQRAAEEAARAEEQRKKDEAELAQWADSFTVTEAGTASTGDDEQDETNLLEQFVQHIQKRKVVGLDELAAKFNVKTQDVISRISTLESDGCLLGVLDDRGKYLCMSESELDSVAAWMERRGRVSIDDLVAQSNKLIDLTPAKDEDEQKEQLVLDDEE